MSAAWAVVRRRETPAAFHARPLADRPERAVWICEATRTALVLGSTQPDEVVDRAACAAAGVEVVRRRSGGGAVLVRPNELVWVDLVVPASDPLWDDDVVRSFSWVGEVWRAALDDLGVAGDVHLGALVRTEWSDLVCFAGVGPGEVTAAGAKVVGVAQRRTRHGARFQCAALLRWDPAALVGLLALAPEVAARAVDELAGVARGLPLAADDVVAALLRQL